MKPTPSSLPRILISGLSGGAGKTTVSLGLARYFAISLRESNIPHDSLSANFSHCESSLSESPQSVCPPASSPHSPRHVSHINNPCFPSPLPPASIATRTATPAATTTNDSTLHTPSFIPRPFELPWEHVRALMYSPRPVQTFKKGPDYIDAAWLGLAAGCITRTLDPYFSTSQELAHNFTLSCQNAELAIIEGNRGIHDGLDAFGSCSSATLAKILHAPVLLVVDCTKMTRTVAALVLGCIQLDPEVTIGGVILNKLGSSRQETLIRQAIEYYTDVPVLGALPRQRKPLLVERKLGLSGVTDTSSAELDTIAHFITKYIDTEAIWHLASATQSHSSKSKDTALSSTLASTSVAHKTPASRNASTPLHTSAEPVKPVKPVEPVEPAEPVEPVECILPHKTSPHTCTSDCANKATSPLRSSATPHAQNLRPTIGYIYDKAIWFYYPENLEALHQAGANLLRLSLFDPLGWDKIDGLYCGGGHLDTHIQPLSQSPQLKKLLALARGGAPIYMEGASLALACRELIINTTSYPMASIFDASMTLTSRPHGLGYTRAHVNSSTPFFDEDATISGHQFNYFRFESTRQLPSYLTLSKGRGLFQTPLPNAQNPLPQESQLNSQGFSYTNSLSAAHYETLFHQHDGLVYHNTCASLSYLFAPTMPQWAPRFVQLCRKYLD